MLQWLVDEEINKKIFIDEPNIEREREWNESQMEMGINKKNRETVTGMVSLGELTEPKTRKVKIGFGMNWEWALFFRYSHSISIGKIIFFLAAH